MPIFVVIQEEGVIAVCDIVLWDLKGKIFREPIWRLIGGFYRDQIPAHVSGLSAKDVGCPAGSEVAQTYIIQGFTSFKGILPRSVVPSSSWNGGDSIV
ncbi:MAG: hypothetical protein VX289_10650 [Candidatus Poribacteria bacterium]|nr:hypothetical protein [Candidatus Poribacteria bacterium]